MLLVDTYNVLHATGALPPDLAGLETGDLAALIAVSRYADRPATLVCDGVRPRGAGDGRIPGVELLYAGHGREADDLIESIIAASSAPGRLLVVSSDRRVVGAARRRRASTLSSEMFLKRLAADRDRPAAGRVLPAFTQEIPLDAYSIAHWMREFGLGEADVDRIRRDLRSRPGSAARRQPPPKPDIPLPDAPAPPPAAASFRVTDPLLLEVLREWAGQISPDDLDMSRWLDDPRSAVPVRKPRPQGRRRGGRTRDD